MKEEIIAYKGFNKDWTCRGFQYEVGKEFLHDGEVKSCNSGFHSCEYPLDVFNYYNPSESAFAIVKASGEIHRDNSDTKLASAKLSIVAEIKIPELISEAIKWITGNCIVDDNNHATGNRSASSATGYQSASSATGNQSASSATGDQSASSATGNQSASSATGYQSASSATGYQSASSATGDQSASSATGKSSIAMASGREGRAMAALGCAIVLCVYNDDGDMVHVKSAIAGQGEVEPDTWYTLSQDGAFVKI